MHPTFSSYRQGELLGVMDKRSCLSARSFQQTDLEDDTAQQFPTRHVQPAVTAMVPLSKRGQIVWPARQQLRTGVEGRAVELIVEIERMYLSPTSVVAGRVGLQAVH